MLWTVKVVLLLSKQSRRVVVNRLPHDWSKLSALAASSASSIFEILTGFGNWRCHLEYDSDSLKSYTQHSASIELLILRNCCSDHLHLERYIT